MNPVLLASASALAEATPEKAAISAPTTSTSGSTFSLPQAGLNAVAERLIGAKINNSRRRCLSINAMMQILRPCKHCWRCYWRNRHSR